MLHVGIDHKIAIYRLSFIAQKSSNMDLTNMAGFVYKVMQKFCESNTLETKFARFLNNLSRISMGLNIESGFKRLNCDLWQFHVENYIQRCVFVSKTH